MPRGIPRAHVARRKRHGSHRRTQQGMDGIGVVCSHSSYGSLWAEAAPSESKYGVVMMRDVRTSKGRGQRVSARRIPDRLSSCGQPKIEYGEKRQGKIVACEDEDKVCACCSGSFIANSNPRVKYAFTASRHHFSCVLPKRHSANSAPS